MTKLQNNGYTVVLISRDEALDVCRMGEGERCCAFLTAGAGGFYCERMTKLGKTTITERIQRGQFVSKGRGGWEGCAWHGEIPNDGEACP